MDGQRLESSYLGRGESSRGLFDCVSSEQNFLRESRYVSFIFCIFNLIKLAKDTQPGSS
jgi:hypothetical protein